MENRPVPLLLLLLAVPVFVVGLGANSIWDANEAFYVETPRQMVLTGDYVTPVFNDVPRLNKPVLSYWIVAALYQVFGISVAVERLGIALGALGILAATFLIGYAVRSTTTGLIAALCIATAPRFVMFARRIFIDIYITLFMVLALACFVLAERYPQHGRRLRLLMYAAVGLGVLTKGPVALVLPALVAAVWLTIEKRWSDIGRLQLLPGIVIIAAIVVPWYAALFVVHGWAPITDFFVGENVGRYVDSMVPGDSRPVHFYLPVLFGDLFPWAPLLVVPLLTAWRPTADRQGSIRRLLWLWVVVIVGVFSLSATKQDLYILPVAPVVAVLVADLLVASAFGRARRAVSVTLVVIAVLSIALGVAGYWILDTGYYQLAAIGLLAGVLIAGGGLTLVAIALGRHRLGVAALAAAFVVFNYVFVLRVMPGLERLKPVVPLARVVTDQAGPDDRLGFYHLSLPSFVYYTGRPVRELRTAEEAVAFYGGGGAWALMDRARYEDLRGRVPGLCVAARHPRFDTKLSDLLAGAQPPDVLLVTNRCGGA